MTLKTDYSVMFVYLANMDCTMDVKGQEAQFVPEL